MSKSIYLYVYKVHPYARLPERKTDESIGFDICACKDYIFKPREFKLVDTGLVLASDYYYGIFIFPRSSLFKKKGLILVNSVGVIDFDYCGEDDTVKLALYNMTDNIVSVKAGERLAQVVLLKVADLDKVKIQVLKEPLRRESRGGFGSTGI